MHLRAPVEPATGEMDLDSFVDSMESACAEAAVYDRSTTRGAEPPRIDAPTSQDGSTPPPPPPPAVPPMPDDFFEELPPPQLRSRASTADASTLTSANLIVQKAAATPAEVALLDDQQFVQIEREMAAAEEKRLQELARAQRLKDVARRASVRSPSSSNLAESPAALRARSASVDVTGTISTASQHTPPSTSGGGGAASQLERAATSGNTLNVAAELAKLNADRERVQGVVAEQDVALKAIAARQLMRVQLRDEVAQQSVAEAVSQRKAIRLEAHQTSVAARRCALSCGGLESTFLDHARDLMASAKCLLVMVMRLVNQTTFTSLGGKLQQAAGAFQQALMAMVAELRVTEQRMREERKPTGSINTEVLNPFVAALKVSHYMMNTALVGDTWLTNVLFSRCWPARMPLWRHTSDQRAPWPH